MLLNKIVEDVRINEELDMAISECFVNISEDLGSTLSELGMFIKRIIYK